MSETILFPPGAAVVSQFLNDALAASGDFPGVTAAGLIPNPRPTSFVRVRTGGGLDIDVAAADATVYVESYAARYSDAAVLAEFCHACLMRASRDGWLGDFATRQVVTISRPQDLPDPLTDQPRMTATYAVRLRGYPI